MTTLLQLFNGIADQLTSNPELADYEVRFVDESTMKEVGATPVGYAMFMGVDDDKKIFDLTCNIPQEVLENFNKEENYLCNSPVVACNRIGRKCVETSLELVKNRLADMGE